MLVGRPNVGKSTLFNRLTRTRRAIVTAIPGTTRDVIAQPVEWRARRSSWSTPGECSARARTRCTQLVLERGRRAIADADLLVLVVDGREGLVRGDREIARAVREAGKPAMLAVNKIDDRRARERRARDSIGSGSSRCSRSPPSTAKASATCSTRSCDALPAASAGSVCAPQKT